VVTIGTYVDDLVALLEKLVDFIGEVVLNTVLRGTIGLVDVYPACRAAELAGDVADIEGSAANCVVEDENARCSSAVGKKLVYALSAGQTRISSHVSFRSCSTSG
jgi:hypothetical protein